MHCVQLKCSFAPWCLVLLQLLAQTTIVVLCENKHSKSETHAKWPNGGNLNGSQCKYVMAAVIAARLEIRPSVCLGQLPWLLCCPVMLPI